MELLKWLGERGDGDVEEITTANETIAFALPKEVRQSRVR